MSIHTFDLRVTVKTDEDNPEPQPEDFAYFLNNRFTVNPGDTYGLDAYNKDAPQLVLKVEVLEITELLADAWDEAVEQTIAWVSVTSRPSNNGPSDPPTNPYGA